MNNLERMKEIGLLGAIEEECVSEWISVKDRLPPQDTPVLVMTSKNIRHSEDYYYMAVSDRYKKDIHTDSGYRFNVRELKVNYPRVNCLDITHWMPLPEAPKETFDP